MTGAVVWFTGLPASGKTTLARRVREQLEGPSVILDSDELREVFAATGYSDHDRDAFYSALAELALLLARQGLAVLVAATAPRRAHRDVARAAPRFLEVWLNTSLAESAQRDVKGLYARARSGEVTALPGVGSPYEPPLSPAVIASGGFDDVAAASVVAWLHG